MNPLHIVEEWMHDVLQCPTAEFWCHFLSRNAVGGRVVIPPGCTDHTLMPQPASVGRHDGGWAKDPTSFFGLPMFLPLRCNIIRHKKDQVRAA